MPEHAATAGVIAVRSFTAMGTVGGRDRDIRVVVLGDEADLVPIVVFSVASRVTVGISVLFNLSKDHLYHPRGTHSHSGFASFQSPSRQTQFHQSSFTTSHQTQQQYQH